MPSLWIKNEKLIVDAMGRPVLCDHCPCGGCGIIPAGSVITLSLNRTITRTKRYYKRREEWDPIFSIHELSEYLEIQIIDNVSSSYTTESDILPGDAIPLVISAISTRTIDSHSYGEVIAKDGDSIKHAEFSAASTGSIQWDAFARRHSSPDAGEACEWYGAHFTSPFNGSFVEGYSWTRIRGDASLDLNSDELKSMENWDNYEESSSSGGGVFAPPNILTVVTTTSYSPLEGSARGEMQGSAVASKSIEEGIIQGEETVSEIIDADWAITPPNSNCNCGL